MLRCVLVLMFSVAASGWNMALAQRPPMLVPGKKFEAELTEKMERSNTEASKVCAMNGLFFGDRYYVAILPVKLKAGQPIEITANVVGDKRRVCLTMIDATGKVIAGTEFKESNQTLKIKNASATGVYAVVVMSTSIGAFDVIAEFEDPEVLTLAAARAKVAQLKKELAAAEAELKALQETKPAPKKP